MGKWRDSGQTIGLPLVTSLLFSRVLALGWESLRTPPSHLSTPMDPGAFLRSETQIQLYSYLTTIQFTTEEDYYEWEINGRISDCFRTGAVYDYLCATHPDVAWSSIVWFSRAIPRHNFHTWLLIQDRIATRDRLLRWGVQTDNRCLLCNTAEESRDHLYFSCNYSYELWKLVAERLRLIPQ